MNSISLIEVYVFLVLLFIYFINKYFDNNIYEYHFRNIMIRNNENKFNRIIYLINPTAGLANTLRGMSSTIFLSYFYSSCFFLKGWDSIRYYFDFPIELIHSGNINAPTFYKRFNRNIFNFSNYINFTLVIKDIYGFLKILIKKFNDSEKMKLLKVIYSIKNVNTISLNSIIYKEIFIPSKKIDNYINLFNIKRRKKKVLGIHIRSGIFSNNFTEHYFSQIHLNHYCNKSRKIIIDFNISYIFIASDNEYYSNKVKKYFEDKVIDITFKGEILHSRFVLYNPLINNNAIRIVSEFILLSNCDVILGTKMSSYSYESCYRKSKYCFFL